MAALDVLMNLHIPLVKNYSVKNVCKKTFKNKL